MQLSEPQVAHFSHSSLSLLLRNPLAFKKKYILKIYESTSSPSGVVGQACHKAVEAYLKGASVEDAITQGIKHIGSVSDVAIEYGKTGSREKMLEDYTAGVKSYFEEMPNWKKREVLFIEEGMTEVIHDQEGNALSLPAKCYSDVIWKSKQVETFEGHTYPKGSLFIEDNKFVRSYTNHDETDQTRLRQAFFNFLIIRERLKEEPAAMLYRETKLSKNKDGTPQSQYYVMDFAELKSELPAFFQLYNDCTRYISNPEAVYLPNPDDMFDGKDAWLTYRQNLITVEAPVVVHRTKQAQFAEKGYVASAVDKVENRDYTPEERIRLKLQEFGIPVEMQQTYENGSVIMYTMKPSRGVKMSTIQSHTKDLAIALKAKTIRVQAPIMGTDMVGVEVPHETRDAIPFLIEGQPDDTLVVKDTLSIPIGLDVYRNAVIRDLRDMPHLLVAGSTGSGKSVFLNVALRAISSQMDASCLKIALIDPKRVELSQFRDLPHLLGRVMYEHREAIKALHWLVGEMEDRYKTLEASNYRNIKAYNDDNVEKIPYIVLVIDEFADLMLTKERGEPAEAELLIVRLAQKARAVGIHLIIATQRPSVDVVTGLIKANLPTRVAFMTTSQTDSKVILDQSGAEELTGRGDMLYLDPSSRGITRLQGFYA